MRRKIFKLLLNLYIYTSGLRKFVGYIFIVTNVIAHIMQRFRKFVVDSRRSNL